MLKKKNIAMMMAVATVATTAVPAFAAVEEQVVTDGAKLVSEVEKMLNTKYSSKTETGIAGDSVGSDTYKNSVYQITYSLGSEKDKEVKSAAQMKNLVEQAKVKNEILKVTVVDKGHTTNEDNRVVAVELTKNLLVTDGSYTLVSNDVGNINDGNKTFTLNSTIGTVAPDGTGKKITLANGKEIEIAADGYQLDMSKPVDANGNLVDYKTTNVEIAKKVVGFKNVQAEEEAEKNIPSKEVAKLALQQGDVVVLNEKASKFYDGKEFTKEGRELVNMLVGANKSAGTTSVINGGKEYTVKFEANDISEVEANKEGGYKLTINLTVNEKKTRLAMKDGQNVQIVITGDVQADLAKIRTVALGSTEVEAPTDKFETIAGEDRFETAVKISEKSYDKFDVAVGNKKAGSIVLVGQDAVVDGLAAGPLAKKNNAPILLAKKDSVPTQTMNEIKRVIEKNPTIYIVGGENTISKDVEAQLISELNAKIVRLAGEDRFDTSLKIAEAMNITSTTDAFIVGGYGEADAMSIASVASREVAPIIVTPKEGLTKDAKSFLKTNKTNIDNIDVIGGESNVSTQVLVDVKEATEKVGERVSGADRQETNAAVINKYYKSKLTGIYVAKDGYVGGTSHLIDALAAAPLAGRGETPIVLATNNISDKQVKAVEDNKTGGTQTMTKIGNGVASSVLEKLIAKLTLK